MNRYARGIAVPVLAGSLAWLAGCGGGGGGGGPAPGPSPTSNARPSIAAISDPAALTVGDTLEVSVSVTDRDASDTHTIEASSDDSVVTVSVDGLTLTLSAQASGTATVTVTATDNSGSANATSPAVSFTVTVQSESGWVRGVFADDADFKDFCAVPRSGVDEDGDAFPDQQGAMLDENNWLRSWSNDTYLWYDEIEDRDPACCDTPTYFQHMKTEATTDSGIPKDQFHFWEDTAAYVARSRSGVSAGYGARFAVLSRRPPRDIRVAYTEPGSPATSAGVDLLRGTRILRVDGVSVTNGAAGPLNAGLFPRRVGETHRFLVQDPGSEETRTVAMSSAVITTDPVQHVRVIETDTGRVGYMLFNSHIAPAERRLVGAIRELADADVEDLVLDLRYNPGGYLVIASQLAYMIAGPSAAQGRVFSELKFNSKHPTFNPVTGQMLRPTLFQTTTVGLSASPGRALPQLNLDRVFIISGPSTCSASESIINSLRGIDLEVILIGATTCGKPYGFYPTDNCGTTYFTVQFQSVNAKGFGDYADGFTPSRNPSARTEVPGCAVADDFNHPFGDPDEARLKAALGYREDETCPETTMAADGFLLAEGLDDTSVGPAIRGLMIPGTGTP
ncbi:MAG: peptidase [Gammaproteobacteria bacterium]|nr:peptidase [Gammaproteobacteria bacterium]